MGKVLVLVALILELLAALHVALLGFDLMPLGLAFFFASALV